MKKIKKIKKDDQNDEQGFNGKFVLKNEHCSDAWVRCNAMKVVPRNRGYKPFLNLDSDSQKLMQ